jgi:hypothetical protein
MFQDPVLYHSLLWIKFEKKWTNYFEIDYKLGCLFRIVILENIQPPI